MADNAPNIHQQQHAPAHAPPIAAPVMQVPSNQLHPGGLLCLGTVCSVAIPWQVHQKQLLAGRHPEEVQVLRVPWTLAGGGQALAQQGIQKRRLARITAADEGHLCLPRSRCKVLGVQLGALVSAAGPKQLGSCSSLCGTELKALMQRSIPREDPLLRCPRPSGGSGSSVQLPAEIDSQATQLPSAA